MAGPSFVTSVGYFMCLISGHGLSELVRGPCMAGPSLVTSDNRIVVGYFVCLISGHGLVDQMT